MITDILKRKIHKAVVSEVSSEKDSFHSAANLTVPNSFWSSSPENKDIQFITFDFEENVLINFIELLAPIKTNPGEKFPEKIIVLGRLENEEWKVLCTDNDLFLNRNVCQINTPLTNIKYLKFVFPAKDTIIEIGQVNAGIKGINAIKGNRSVSPEKSINCLTDSKNDTFYEPEKDESGIYTIRADLGEIEQINYISMSSAGIIPHKFPQEFVFELSTDNKVWMTAIDQKDFSALPGEKYLWNISGINARYIKIDIHQKSNDSIKIADLGVYSSPANNTHTHTSSENPGYATIFQPGIVRLAKDGETSRDAAIRASDIRLKDASTIFKGIMRFAEDGEESPMLAVQASDSRLSKASEIQEGIVRLAYDRESKPATAVQGNDSRLREATLKSFGIVKLCPDGEYSEIGVVRGSDTRLKNASTHSPGIVKLAENGGVDSDTAVQGNDKRLKDATTSSKGIVQFAEDKSSEKGRAIQANDSRLQPATVNSHGTVELADIAESSPGKVLQSNDPRVQPADTINKGIVELAENNEVKPCAVVQSNDDRLRNATTAYAGITRLAEHGETTANTAVQSTDPRLRDATTVAKGIVELAEDGESIAGVVVQGNDKRLKDATTVSKGIVELAEDGEDSSGVVVQGNDKRLKDAGINEKGILAFAENLEEKPLKAVQSNDDRLKDATESSKGILRFAEDGEISPKAAVQGNDRRLRDATETCKGILQFAADGEKSELKALQAHDKRLNDATTISKGIVELAEDGEDSIGVVVQGNDKRLKQATCESYGIMRFAEDGQNHPSFAVQSNDKRLSDSRNPLPHEHDYAPKEHSFNSHSGFISIEGEKSQSFQGITPPVSDSAIIYSKNISQKEGSIAISGVSYNENPQEGRGYGIFGHSNYIGIRGQSNSTGENENGGCGILGISRKGAGGVFSSEQNYSLILDGYGNIDDIDSSIKMIGNGKALQVRGESDFEGKINISTSEDKNNENPANIVEYFTTDEEEYISIGDILVASSEGNSKLSRTHKEYDTKICGIVSGNPSIIFNNTGEKTKIYPLALTGKVMCKVDARNTPILPGDMITSSGTPGCGMKATIDNFNKIGSVIGKALAPLKEGIGTIPVMIFHA